MQCVQETCNFDTIFSYLTCGNYDVSAASHPTLFTQQHPANRSNAVFAVFFCSSATICLRGEHDASKPTMLDHELTTHVSVCAASARAARSARPWPTSSRCTPSCRRTVRLAVLNRAAFLLHCVEIHVCTAISGLGLDKAIEDCKYRMSRYSVTPNVRCCTLKPCPCACRGAESVSSLVSINFFYNFLCPPPSLRRC